MISQIAKQEMAAGRNHRGHRYGEFEEVHLNDHVLRFFYFTGNDQEHCQNELVDDEETGFHYRAFITERGTSRQHGA